jgi:murein DD-endopeptidase MepM/ murein hydrolase activator NlpD
MRHILLILLSFLSTGIFAQGITNGKNYPTTDFRFPLDLSPAISGTFGEVRSNHLHSGMDIRTNQTAGHPVYAVADGYICRLRVQIGGFGNAVYINHPNGYTSVYAHLQRFNPRIAKTIKDYQYNQQQYDVDFPLLPINIPVRKGEIIAWSGNTGSSGGPHLHFEIRDTNTEEIINPQLFGITIPDNVKPVIAGIYLYNLNNESFSEKTSKQYFPVKGAAGDYSLIKSGAIMLDGTAAFGISAYDQTQPGGNHNGIYSIELKVNNKTVYLSTIDRFAFGDSQAANSYIDYPEFQNSGRMIQKSFIEPGNPLAIYKTSIYKGLIDMPDTFTHKAEYIVKDVRGNTSTLVFGVKGSGRVVNGKIIIPANKFYYNKSNDFSTDAVKVSIPVGALYSTIDFTYSQSAKIAGYSAVHHIHTRQIPVHQDYNLWIKPDGSLDPALYDKALIVDTKGKSCGGDYEDGYVKTMAGVFGNFYVTTDNMPPTISPQNISDGKSMAGVSRMTFRISDNLSGIKSFKGTIDGNWILMEFDQKTATLWHTFDERTSSGKHTFQLEVTDKKLNTKTYTATFYR